MCTSLLTCPMGYARDSLERWRCCRPATVHSMRGRRPSACWRCAKAAPSVPARNSTRMWQARRPAGPVLKTRTTPTPSRRPLPTAWRARRALTPADLDGQISSDACQCGERFYLADTGAENAVLTCASCPSGATCSSGVCALRTPDQTCPGSSDPIPGAWVRSTSGEDAGKYRALELPSRPPEANGFARHAKVPPVPRFPIHHQSGSRCVSEVPAWAAVPRQCRYVPVVDNSTWAPDNGVYKLRRARRAMLGSASTMALLPTSNGAFHARKEPSACWRCAKAAPIASQEQYKDVAGTQACRACPQNTYNPYTKSKAFANCLACPSGADTAGLDGQISSDACQCGERFYLADTGAENAV